MKRPCITIAGGCLAALFLAGCSGMSPTSTANALGAAARGASSPASDRCPGLRVYPRRPVITVNQQLTLSDVASYGYGYGYGACDKQDEAASWKSSRGGRIRPVNGGLKAIFSAERPGVYRVHAKWNGRHDVDTVTVTSS